MSVADEVVPESMVDVDASAADNKVVDGDGFGDDDGDGEGECDWPGDGAGS